MTRTLLILGTLLLAILLMGACGHVPANLTASDGQIKITVESIERTNIMPAEVETEHGQPLENHNFIVLSLRIDSLTGGHASPSPPEILIDTSAREYTPIALHFTTVLENPDDFFHSDYCYKEGEPGILVYELPETAEPSMLRFPYRRTGTEEEGMIEVNLATK